MANYTKITDFAVKDSLLTGNPLKLITGTAHDNEYNAISTAIATKAELNGSATQTFSGAAATTAAHFVRLDQISLMPSVASATTIDIFGAAGATIDLTGTTTVTGLTACTAAQVGSKKTIIPSNAAGVSFTASANMTVDGATSGSFLMPLDAIVEVLATSTTTFKVRTVFAQMAWTPYYELATPGTSSFGTYAVQSGKLIKIGNKISAYMITIGGTFSVGTGSGLLYVTGLPIANNSSIAGTADINFTDAFVTLAPTHGRVPLGSNFAELTSASGAAYTSITAAHCASGLRVEACIEYFV